jgi:WD40 repeat protein
VSIATLEGHASVVAHLDWSLTPIEPWDRDAAVAQAHRIAREGMPHLRTSSAAGDLQFWNLRQAWNIANEANVMGDEVMEGESRERSSRAHVVPTPQVFARDAAWATHTCPVGWSVQGIWTPHAVRSRRGGIGGLFESSNAATPAAAWVLGGGVNAVHTTEPDAGWADDIVTTLNGAGADPMGVGAAAASNPRAATQTREEYASAAAAAAAAAASGSSPWSPSRTAALAVADDAGCVTLFRYPAVGDDPVGKSFAAHSLRVSAVRWTSGNEYLITTGANDRCIFQWKSDYVQEADAAAARRSEEAVRALGVGGAMVLPGGGYDGAGDAGGYPDVYAQLHAPASAAAHRALALPSAAALNADRNRRYNLVFAQPWRSAVREPSRFFSQSAAEQAAAQRWLSNSARLPSSGLILDHVHGFGNTAVVLPAAEEGGGAKRPAAGGGAGASWGMGGHQLGAGEAPQCRDNLRFCCGGDAVAFFAAALGVVHGRRGSTQTAAGGGAAGGGGGGAHGKQRLHNGHRRKIVCMDVHSEGHIAATGDFSGDAPGSPKPSILLWDTNSGNTLVAIAGFHRVGIALLAFCNAGPGSASSLGDRLVSVGLDEDRCVAVHGLDGALVAFARGRAFNGCRPSALCFGGRDGDLITVCGAARIQFWTLDADGLHSKKGIFGGVGGGGGSSGGLFGGGAMHSGGAPHGGGAADAAAAAAAAAGGGGAQPHLMCLSMLGNDVVTGQGDGSLYLWKGRCRTQVRPGIGGGASGQQGHASAVTSLCPLDDGEGVASGSLDGTVILWDRALRPTARISLATSELLRPLVRGPLRVRALRVRGGAASAVRTLLVGTFDGEVLEVTTLSDAEAGGGGGGGGGGRRGDGGPAASVLSDAVTGAHKLAEGHSFGAVRALAAHPTKQEYATAADDGTVRVWDAPSRRLVARATVGGARGGGGVGGGGGDLPRCLAYSVDGAHLAIGLADGALLICDSGLKMGVAQRAQRQRQQHQQQHRWQQQQQQQQQQQAAALQRQRQQTKQQGQQHKQPSQQSLAMRSASVAGGGGVPPLLIDDDSIYPLSRAQLAHCSVEVRPERKAAPAALHRLPALGAHPLAAHTRNQHHWTTVVNPPFPPTPPVLRPHRSHRSLQVLRYSPDGNTLAAGLGDGRILLLRSPEYRVRNVCRGHRAPLIALDFSADSRWMQSNDAFGALNFWDTATGRCETNASATRDVQVRAACLRAAVVRPSCLSACLPACPPVRLPACPPQLPRLPLLTLHPLLPVPCLLRSGPRGAVRWAGPLRACGRTAAQRPTRRLLPRWRARTLPRRR